VLLRNHQHAAGSAARIVYSADNPFPPDTSRISRQHEIDHQVHHIARRKVLAGILVQSLVKLPKQLFEDRPHCRIVDLVGM
jgi:hypothetical protein